MAYTCTICGETLQSDGAAGLHELVVHVNPDPPPPPPPPSGHPAGHPAGPVGDWGDLEAGPRRSGLGRVAVTLSVALIGAILAGAVVAIALGRDGSSVSTAAVATGETAEASTSRPGFQRVSKPAEGFSIDLPEAMAETPLTAEGLATITDAVGTLNPAVAGVLAKNDKVLDQIRLLAIDPVSGNTQVVQQIKARRGVNIEDAPKGMFSEQYRQVGAVADEAMVQLPAGDALLVSVQLPMGQRTVTVTQYVLAHDGHVWVLTNAGPNGASDAADIASTFRFL